MGNEMRYNELIESPQIGLAKKAYKELSHDARHAIDEWEAMNWTGGSLEQHIKANDDIAKDIAKAFQPVKDALPKKVKLYRGFKPEGDYDGWKNKYLESWTDDKRVAEYFAGLRRSQNGKSNIYDVISDDDIKKLVNQYNDKGYLKYRNHYYIRNKEYPQYYNIYDKNKQFVTDGDNLYQDLKSDNDNLVQMNKEKLDKATVLEKDIDKNDIIWISNQLGSKEYIVRKQK